MEQTTRTRITSEELTMVRDYILMPYMLEMAERSLEQIKGSSNILKRMYAMCAQVVINEITKDLQELKRQLKRADIKVVEDQHEELIHYSRFYCRGYTERFGIMRDVMKAEISVRFGKYVAEVTNKLK